VQIIITTTILNDVSTNGACAPPISKQGMNRDVAYAPGMVPAAPTLEIEVIIVYTLVLADETGTDRSTTKDEALLVLSAIEVA